MNFSTLTNSELSESIRKKKKKMMESEPELVGTEPGPDMNAQDIYDVEQHGRVEGTLLSPKKINADLTNIDENEEYSGVGVSPKDRKRLERVRRYFDMLHMSRDNKMMLKREME